MISSRVSIIVPVYNVEKYIVECLQSVADQTVADKIECIVVDDCGPDNSFTVAKEWVNGYRSENRERSVDFKLVQREKNGGLSAARNTGVKEATGEYLYFLDSDDYLIPIAIETLINLADKHGGVDLLPALYITDDGRLDHFSYKALSEFSDDRKLIKQTLLDFDRVPVTAANRLIRREFIVKHQLWFKEGIIHEDNYWTFFLAKHVKRIAFCTEKIYYYRTTAGSIMTSKNIPKESLSFRTIISDFCNNIDSFEEGAQKTLILNTIILMLRGEFYESNLDKEKLIKLFKSKNRLVERLLLNLYLITNNSQILHLLIRLYNL